MLRFESEQQARQGSVLVLTPAGTALGIATAAIVYAAVDTTASAASSASKWAGDAVGAAAGAAATYMYGPAAGVVTAVTLRAGADTASSAIRVAGRWGAAAAAALTGAVTALTVTAVEHGARVIVARFPITGADPLPANVNDNLMLLASATLPALQMQIPDTEQDITMHEVDAGTIHVDAKASHSAILHSMSDTKVGLGESESAVPRVQAPAQFTHNEDTVRDT